MKVRSEELDHVIALRSELRTHEPEKLLAGENRLLEMVARGRSLAEVLTALCRLIEELSSGSLCGILLVNTTGDHVEHGAAPSLPPDYNEAIHGRPVNANAGPCGMAACLKEQVIVTDVASDTRWDAEWRTLALAHGLRACWSTPIFSSEGSVLGTFAIYWREPRSPTARDQMIIGQTTHLASIAIERKRTEAALLESEERFRRMADAIPEVIWFTSLEPEKVLYVSPSFERIWGLQVEKLYENPRLWIETIHPDDRERVAGLFSSWVAGEQVSYHNVEYRIVQPGGAVRWIHEHGVLSLNEQGKAYLASGISTDITERKQAEEELRRSEAYLAEAQRLSLTGSFGWCVATGQLVWSDETFCILGYDRTTKPALELVLKRVHPDDVNQVQRTIDRATRGLTDFDLEHRLLMPDGRVKHVHVVARATKAESGAVEFVGAVMDITERKKTQEAMRSAKARFEGILEIADDAIISVDLNQNIVLFNQGAEKVFGYPQTEVIGKPLDLLLPQRSAHAHREDIEKFAKSPEVSRSMAQRREVFGRRKDGSEFPAEASISKLNLGAELVFTVILRDITERKQAAEALRASEHLARGQLAALTRTLDSLAQESDPDQLPKHVVTTIVNQMDAHSATIWERSGDALDLLGVIEEGRFKTRIEAGFFGGSIPVIGHAPPLWVEALRTGAHTVIEDIDKEPSRIILADGRSAVWRTTDLTAPFAFLKTHLAALGVRRLLIAPMMLAGQLAGIIGIRFTGTRVFGPQEIDLTKALAHQAMLAMQLMRLSQQSRESAVEAERNRMARDIHDTLAQGFTGVIMQLEAAKGATTHGDLAEAANRVERAGELARSSLGEARRSVRALRPRSLRSGKLFVALDNLLKRMTEGTDLNAEFHAEGDGRSIPADSEEGLLRITQEALTNAVKHANARNFNATLSVVADKIQLRLVDDGRGFDPQMEYEGFGLIGMKERVDQLGGEFIVRSKPGVGTEILVELKNQSALKPENRNEQD